MHRWKINPDSGDSSDVTYIIQKIDETSCPDGEKDKSKESHRIGDNGGIGKGLKAY